MELIKTEFVSEHSERVGAPGSMKFTFKAVHEGTTTIMFTINVAGRKIQIVICGAIKSRCIERLKYKGLIKNILMLVCINGTVVCATTPPEDPSTKEEL